MEKEKLKENIREAKCLKRGDKDPIYCLWCREPVDKDTYILDIYGNIYCNYRCLYNYACSRGFMYLIYYQKQAKKQAPRSKDENYKYQHLWRKYKPSS